MSDQAKPDKPLKPVPATPIPSRERTPSPTSQEIQHTPQITASEVVTEPQTVPETPEGRYDEMRDILTSLNRELIPDAS